MKLSNMQEINFKSNFATKMSQYQHQQSSQRYEFQISYLLQFAANNEQDQQTLKIIEKLQLNRELLVQMFKQIEFLIDDPIKMDCFYLEMRLTNDPDMSKHAEDYNFMVLEMVKGS